MLTEQQREAEQQRELYRRQPCLTYEPTTRSLAERWHVNRRRRAWVEYCERGGSR